MSVLTLQKTPLQHLPLVSKELGCAVYVKREDLCHKAHGGNKTRKLAYALAQALKNGATDIVTMGAIGSNHVWATAFHARALGMPVHAVLLPHAKNPRAETVCAKTLELGARLIVAKNDLDLLWRVSGLKRALKKQGRQPYVLGPGGSSPLSSQAYVDATREVLEQTADTGLMDAAFCALGSGGTLAGLWAGSVLLNLPWRIFGVSTRKGFAQSQLWIWHNARRTLRLQSCVRTVPFDGIQILKSKIGPGYGQASPESRAAAALFRQDGIELENTYTAKTAAGLIETVQAHPEWQSVLLWLTHVPVDFMAAALPETYQATFVR